MLENPCFLMLFGMVKLDESAGFVRLIHALLSVSGSAGGSEILGSPRVADTGHWRQPKSAATKMNRSPSCGSTGKETVFMYKEQGSVFFSHRAGRRFPLVILALLKGTMKNEAWSDSIA